MTRRRLAPTLSALLVSLPAALAVAQNPPGSVLPRTPNMVTNWVGEPGTIQFNFIHRFTESGAPQHQISNVPTFFVAAGLPARLNAGFAYSTSSEVVLGRPNQWEFFLRDMPFRPGNKVADVTLHLGHNVGAASTDGELGIARSFGALRLLAAGRAFSNAFGEGDRRTAAGAGVNVKLMRWLAASGDINSMMNRRVGERIGWSGGLMFGVPTTPHSFSIHATNTVTGTLEGISLGTRRTRWGFEYTVPITLSRYIPALRPKTAAPDVVAQAQPAAAGAASGDTVRASMKQLEFAPARLEVAAGATVVWTNDAPLPHSIVADNGSFDSGLIDVGKRYARTFSTPGTYTFHCQPHPFMKGVVVVR